MKDMTKNEMQFVLKILKSPETEYNATSIAKELKMSAMGALKIARELEKEGIITGTKKGKAIFYKLNLNKEYVKQYVKFLLQREAAQSSPYIRVWLRELQKLKHADALILFGSVLRKNNEARDIDVVVVTRQQTFSAVEKEVEEVNSINLKKFHPLYQTKEDLRDNIRKPDKVVLNAIKGIIVKGENLLVGALRT